MVSSSAAACAASLASEYCSHSFFQYSIHLFERDIFRRLARLWRLLRLLPFFVFRTRRLPAVAVSGADGAGAALVSAALSPTALLKPSVAPDTDSFVLPHASDSHSIYISLVYFFEEAAGITLHKFICYNY